jgi:hypothetical protein
MELSPREKRDAKMEIPQRSQHVEEDEQCTERAGVRFHSDGVKREWNFGGNKRMIKF